MKSKKETSWENVAQWYSDALDSEKWYFHKNIIIPKGLKLLKFEGQNSLLDLACGNGILSWFIPESVDYLGIDKSESLIREARDRRAESNIKSPRFFEVGDISKKFFFEQKNFSHAAIILALQNVEKIFNVFSNAAYYLKENGRFLIVINHPYFRIPKATSWELDKEKEIQYRRVDRYYTNHEIPIDMTPGKPQNKDFTLSFHYSLEYITRMLRKTGFVIDTIEEWVSEKKSEGKAAKMENFARSEFPMFMAILAKKTSQTYSE